MSPHSIRPLSSLLVLVPVLLAGCEATDSLIPSESSVVQASVGAIPGDDAAIQGLVDALTAAWDAKDPAAYAAPYAIDGDFVNPLGGLQKGREAFRAQHAFLFSGPFAGSSNTLTVRNVLFLTGTVATVDLTSRITDYAYLPGNGLAETEPGVVIMRIKWVMLKRAGVWQILQQQATLVAPS